MLKKSIILTCVASLIFGFVSANDAVRGTSDRTDSINNAVTVTTTNTASIKPEGTPAMPKTVIPVSTEKKIGINLASRILILYEGNTKIRMYPVGVGRIWTPTPTGFYKIQNKEINPTWVDPEDTTIQVGSGPENPLGYRWMGYDGTYGIHGTNNPSSIGGYVSNGCIRLFEENVEELYPLVQVGTPVEIYYDRIVIDSSRDHLVSYYIYPDGYGQQSLSVDAVKKALAGYGVENFVESAAIAAKIKASDGQPTYVGRIYDLTVNGTKLTLRAFGNEEGIYIPAVAVAKSLGINLAWSAKKKMLTSEYGTVPGIVKSDTIYLKATDAEVLYRLTGELTDSFQYRMTTKRVETPTVEVLPEATFILPTENSENSNTKRIK